MKTVRDYQRHAEECEALAAKATSTEQRQMITDMANTWRLLAAQREQKLRNQAEERRRAELLAQSALPENADAKD